MTIGLQDGFAFGGPLHFILPEFLLKTQRVSEFSKPQYGSDEYWMLQAFKESLLGIGISNPNPTVGCVLVDSSGTEIARGHTQAYPGCHAERDAFNQLHGFSQWVGSTAYITLEPCSHQGNQPPCVDLLIASEIKRVVIARFDPNPLVRGAGIKKLQEAGKEVELGPFKAESTAWNFPFFAYQTLKRPVIALKWAQTLDGQLTDDSFHSQWISGDCARAYTHWLRQRYDAILVGGQTVLTDAPQLTARNCAHLDPSQPLAQPLPMVFDPQGLCLKLDVAAQKRLKDRTFSESRTVVYITLESTLNLYPSPWIERQKNIILLKLPGTHLLSELINLFAGAEVTKALGHPLQSVMIEGGPKTLTSFLNSGLADLLHVIISPKITGGLKNRIYTHRLLQESEKFQLVSTSRLGDDLLIELIPSQLYSQVFQN